MKITSLLILSFVAIVTSEVYNSKYRSVNRLAPYPGNRKFSLTRFQSGSYSSGGLRRRFGLRRRHHSSQTLGQTSALRGNEGSFDLNNQQNSILTSKEKSKPTKDEVSKSNKINIETPISKKVERKTQTENALLGGTAILHCTFDNTLQIGSYKQAQIWWTKLPSTAADRPIVLAAGNQVRIPDDRLKVITFPDNQYSILVIQNAIDEDAGDYKCSLPTTTGTKTAFTSLSVKESSSVQLSTSAKENAIELGQAMNLFCRPDNSRLNVWWSAKNEKGVSINVIDGFDKLQSNSLTINQIRRDQAGVYTCHVENPDGQPIRRHFNVQVKERPTEIAAYQGGFAVNSFLGKYNKDPKYGDNVNLRCDSSGIPVPTVNWYKNGRLLTNSAKFNMFSYEPSYKDSSVIAKLTITNFQPSDDGTYSCVAENDIGSREKAFAIQGYYENFAPIDDEDQVRLALRGKNGYFDVEGSGFE